jgi:hypothetical protein
LGDVEIIAKGINYESIFSSHELLLLKSAKDGTVGIAHLYSAGEASLADLIETANMPKRSIVVSGTDAHLISYDKRGEAQVMRRGAHGLQNIYSGREGISVYKQQALDALRELKLLARQGPGHAGK